MSSAICFNLDQSKILSSGNELNKELVYCKPKMNNTGTGILLRFQQYSVTSIQRPPKGNNESGLLQNMIFQCRFFWVYLRRDVVSEQSSLKVVDCLIQVVSNTGLTVQGTLFKFVE